MDGQIKVAIVVGHEQKAKGALAVDPLSCYEYDFNKDLAVMLASELSILNIQSKIFLRDGVGIHGAYDEVNEYAPACAIELHFNSCSLPNVAGTETLYVPRRTGSKELAGSVHAQIVACFGRRGGFDRGVKIVDPSDRGYVNLTQANCPQILIEPFFGSNTDDCGMALRFKGYLATDIAKGIQNFVLP